MLYHKGYMHLVASIGHRVKDKQYSILAYLGGKKWKSSFISEFEEMEFIEDYFSDVIIFNSTAEK